MCTNVKSKVNSKKHIKVEETNAKKIGYPRMRPHFTSDVSYGMMTSFNKRLTCSAYVIKVYCCHVDVSFNSFNHTSIGSV